MKKRMLLICAVLAGVMLLTSCTGLFEALRPAPKTADELLERIQEEMQEYTAYALSLDMEMVMVIEEYTMQATATGSIIEDHGEDYYYYTETNMDMRCDELEIKEKMRSISAYADGNAFEFSDDGDRQSKLFCKMTAEEYAAYQALDKSEDQPDQEIDFRDCTTMDFVQNEDKSWTLSCSGYTKKAIDMLTDAFSMQDMNLFGADVVDIKVTILANEQFHVTEITMAFEFDTPEDAKATPKLDIRLKMTAMGDEVVRLTEMLDTSKYKEVDDLAICKQLDNMLEDKYEAEQGEFDYKLKQTIKVMGQSESYSSTEHAKYGTEDGNFYYTITTEIDGVPATVSYRNGKQTVTMQGESYDEVQSEQEAKDFIKDMINDPSFGYSSDLVTDVKDKGDGVWEIELETKDNIGLEAFYEALGGTYRSATQTATVTVTDGKPVKICHDIKSSGYVKSGNDTFEVTWTISLEVTFQN
ncbi:MAG: hypothetical protein E7581_05070 [Ruminococcaceae bacterium]|nr:hypothetical protein [Oscillospiraceae bacterium]